MLNIRAGSIAEINRSTPWVFVDLGFSSKQKSCGLLVNDGEPNEVTFSELVTELSELCIEGNGPLSLVLEAPLSVAFGKSGNPAGRSIEKRASVTRYWYVGLGCSVLVSATYVLRALQELPADREVRLFEGMASFKAKGGISSHMDDVRALRNVVWKDNVAVGRVFGPEELVANEGDRLISAFRVSGMDFGIPPVICVDSAS